MPATQPRIVPVADWGPQEERHLHPTSGTVAALGAAFAAYKLWNATGARLALFVSVIAGAAVAVDVVWSKLATRRVTVSVIPDATDVTVRDVLGMRTSVKGPRHRVVLRMGSKDSQQAVVDSPDEGWAYAALAARGVATSVIVEVTSFGVAGLIRTTQRRPVAFAHPVWVAPRPVQGSALAEATGVWGERATRPALDGDAVRSIRPYLPGDARRRVHWPATARHGELMVKELDDPGAPRMLLVVDLRPGGETGEAAAARAAWYALQALARGYRLTVVTREAAGVVTAPVGSPRLAGRRLASAVVSAGPEVLEGWVGRDGRDDLGVLVVTGAGDSWR